MANYSLVKLIFTWKLQSAML